MTMLTRVVRTKNVVSRRSSRLRKSSGGSAIMIIIILLSGGLGLFFGGDPSLTVAARFHFVLLDTDAGVPCSLHGVDVRIENDRIEVPDHDGERGQHGLVKMDGGGDV